MTILTIIQDAADRLNLPAVSSVIGNQDQTIRGLLQALVQEGKDLLTEDPPWASLILEHTFETEENIEEYVLPDDYQRMINNTCWDRNQYWQVRGGLTPQQWQVIKSGLYQTARLSANFRIKQNTARNGKSFYLDPVPGSQQDQGPRTLVFEYQSNSWVYSPSVQNRSTRPTNDTDEVIFDEEMMTQGVRWRWRQARDLPYAALLSDYRDYRDKLIAQDRAPPTLSINEQPWRLPLGNIPDTGFGFP